DALPAALDEERARLERIEAMLLEGQLARAVQERDLAAEVLVALIVDDANARVRGLGRAVDLRRLARLVVVVLLREVEDAERVVLVLEQHDVVAGVKVAL